MFHCRMQFDDQEKSSVLSDLELKARMTTETLNGIAGVKCNEVMGAMYAFPQINIPENAIRKAKVSNQFYLITNKQNKAFLMTG